jgi:hypothetical protein
MEQIIRLSISSIQYKLEIGVMKIRLDKTLMTLQLLLDLQKEVKQPLPVFKNKFTRPVVRLFKLKA